MKERYPMQRQFVPLVAVAVVVLVLLGLMAAHALFTGSDVGATDVTALINAWPKKWEGPCFC
jgi:hypothetical protein